MRPLQLPEWAQGDVDALIAGRRNGQVTINFREGEIDSVDVRCVVRPPKVDKPRQNA